MEQILSILEKIKNIAAGTEAITSIEKDLMLRYTRDLYETVLSAEYSVIGAKRKEQDLPEVQTLTEEPELLPEEVISEDQNTGSEENREKEEIPVAENTVSRDTAIELAEGEHGATLLPGEPGQPGLHSGGLEEQTEEQTKEERTEAKETFVLESVFQDEKPPLFQPKSSTDFRVWNRDIRSYIGINDKYNFISELFGRNSEAYEEILNEINQCETKQDALRFLENAGITTLYEWKEEGFSEQIFYNVLSQFFSAR